MKTRRFGLIQPPSIFTITHQFLTRMLEDLIRFVPGGALFDQNASPALAVLRPRLHPNMQYRAASLAPRIST